MDSERDLICVKFPGIVNNVEKAIECLGGLKSIAEVHNVNNVKRLGLNFNPVNPLLKNVYADYKKTAGVLFKVKVKKTKVDNCIKKEVISTNVVGRVSQIYKFEGMGDFQYMPIDTSGKEPRCILEEILPSGTESTDFLKREQAPTYIVPEFFAKSDKPYAYRYTDKKVGVKKLEGSGLKEGEILDNKRTRLAYPLFQFNLTDEWPSEPSEYYTKILKSKLMLEPSLATDMEICRKAFEQRPIWSNNAINYETKVKKSALKYVLPCLAVFVRNGPWRKLWVKFGYDPRKDPGAVIYQTLDFRVRTTAGVHAMVSRQPQRNRKMVGRGRGEQEEVEEVVAEGAVFFRPGLVLTQRQIFYQFCDIQLPEVQELLRSGVSGSLCHPRRGFLTAGTPDACRDHIFRYAKQTLLASHSADLKLEKVSSDEDRNSEDDDDNTSEANDADFT